MKYKVDEWVIYIPYDFYDYEIFIDGEGKIKKVSEHKLFPIPEPTY